MLENIQGDSWGSIPPLHMPSLLPHDLCHRQSSSRWLPAVWESVLGKIFKMSLFRSGERSTPLRYAAQRMESYYGWKNTKLAHILYLIISYYTWMYTHHLISSLVYEWSLWISSEVYSLMNWHVRDDGIVTSAFLILYRLLYWMRDSAVAL